MIALTHWSFAFLALEFKCHEPALVHVPLACTQSCVHMQASVSRVHIYKMSVLDNRLYWKLYYGKHLTPMLFCESALDGSPPDFTFIMGRTFGCMLANNSKASQPKRQWFKNEVGRELCQISSTPILHLAITAAKIRNPEMLLQEICCARYKYSWCVQVKTLFRG